VRREVLQELWPLRPAVAELVTMDARAFQSAEGGRAGTQAAHAMGPTRRTRALSYRDFHFQ